MSKKGQVYLASAIYRAFKEYKRDFEKDNKAYEYRKKALETGKVKKEKESPPKKQVHSVNGPEYRVQFYTNTKKIPVGSSRFKNVKNVEVYYHNGLYKYTSGRFARKADAVALQKKLKSIGYRDAFVVAFYNGKRISLAEADRLAKK